MTNRVKKGTKKQKFLKFHSNQVNKIIRLYFQCDIKKTPKKEYKGNKIVWWIVIYIQMQQGNKDKNILKILSK